MSIFTIFYFIWQSTYSRERRSVISAGITTAETESYFKVPNLCRIELIDCSESDKWAFSKVTGNKWDDGSFRYLSSIYINAVEPHLNYGRHIGRQKQARKVNY